MKDLDKSYCKRLEWTHYNIAWCKSFFCRWTTQTQAQVSLSSTFVFDLMNANKWHRQGISPSLAKYLKPKSDTIGKCSFNLSFKTGYKVCEREREILPGSGKFQAAFGSSLTLFHTFCSTTVENSRISNCKKIFKCEQLKKESLILKEFKMNNSS